MTPEEINNQDKQNFPTAERKMQENREKGLYYNASYEIEEFMNVHRGVVEREGTDGKITYAHDLSRTLNDPTLTGFKIFFHFGDSDGLLAVNGGMNTALKYLERNGELARKNLLNRFIEALTYVSTNCSWIFQNITGLQELFVKERPNVLHTDSKVEIETLETMDGKIASLIQMYRAITYDDDRKVWVLPENLRKFSMSIYVYDYRKFRAYTDSKNVKVKEEGEKLISILNNINNDDISQLNHSLFELSDCTFGIESGGAFFANVDNNLSEFVGNNLVIHTEYCYISQLFNTITGTTALNSKAVEIAKVGVGDNAHGLDKKEWKLTDMKGRLERLKQTQLAQGMMTRADELKNLLNANYLKKMGMNILQEGEQRLLDRVEAELSKMYFGNVHGFGIDDVLRINEDNNYRSIFTRTYSTISGNQSLEGGDVYRDDLGNVND